MIVVVLFSYSLSSASTAETEAWTSPLLAGRELSILLIVFPLIDPYRLSGSLSFPPAAC